MEKKQRTEEQAQRQAKMVGLLVEMGSAANKDKLSSTCSFLAELEAVLNARALLSSDRKLPPDVNAKALELVSLMTEDEVGAFQRHFPGVTGDARLDAARAYTRLLEDLRHYISSPLGFGRCAEGVVGYWDKGATLPEPYRADLALRLLHPQKWGRCRDQCFHAVMMIEARGGDLAFTDAHYKALEDSIAKSGYYLPIGHYPVMKVGHNSRFLQIVCKPAMNSQNAGEALQAFIVCGQDPLSIPGTNPILRMAAKMFQSMYTGK